MGMFDDLVPASPAKSGGMFDDLVPEMPKIDFSRPIPEVRAEIAKLPEGLRPEALKQWATAYVAKEREGVKAMDLIPGAPSAAPNPKRINDFVRSATKGTIVGTFADEMNALTDAAMHKVTGGSFGSPYDESMAYQKALDEAILQEDPVGAVASQVGGALSTGAPILKALGVGKPIKGAKDLVKQTAATGAGGAAAGYTAGLGEGEGDFASRHEYATSGEGKLFGLSPVEMGGIVGTILPPTVAGAGKTIEAVRDAASPTLARWGANAEDLLKRYGIRASADGSEPNVSVGGRAAAEQMIANQLAREGKSVDDLRALLAQIDEARRLDSNSRAPDATVLADLTPGTQRLAGSAVRDNPEAAGIAANVIKGRQTGITPQEGPEALARAGIPTRQMFSPPVTGQQAERRFGTDFGTPQKDTVPMGQGERIMDAFKRALLIKDEKLHGHQANAYRTDEAILEAAKTEAKPAYNALYKAGDNISIAPELTTALQKWLPDAERLAREPEEIKEAMRKIVGMFAPKGSPISHIEHFDKTKRLLDDKIGNALESLGDNKSKAMGAVLSEFKDDIIKSVDGIKRGGLGDLYAQTRAQWSSAMESRRALQAGKDAWKDDSDIGIDAWRAITQGKEGDEKLFRLGLWSGAQEKAKRMKRGANKESIFDAPNIQELLTEVIPRSARSSAEFADRPERFGRFLQNEKRMVETRDVVQGNSATAQRMKDDDAYNVMSRWEQMKERMGGSASITMATIRGAEYLLGKLFGLKADTSAELAKMLFTARPEQRARALAAIEMRLGRNRAEQFTRLLEEHQRNVISATAKQGAQPELPLTEGP